MHSLVADDGGVRGTDWNGIEQNVLRDRTASEGVQCRELILGEGGRKRGREGGNVWWKREQEHKMHKMESG